MTSKSRGLGSLFRLPQVNAENQVFAAVGREQHVQIVIFCDGVRDVRQSWIKCTYKWYTLRFVDVFGL